MAGFARNVLHVGIAVVRWRKERRGVGAQFDTPFFVSNILS